MEIENELNESAAGVLITLGDLPLRWFTSHFGSKRRLAQYPDYGHLHPLKIGNREIQLLPLVHPRQAGQLGSYSRKWFNLHSEWVKNVPPDVIFALTGC